MKVLMVGVHKSTKGGMWTVVDNYINNNYFCNYTNLKYIATSVCGNPIKKIIFSIFGVLKIFIYTLFNDYDIIHVHMSERMSVFRKGLIIKISKLRNSKVVIHMHGAEFEKWFNTLNTKKQKRVKSILNSSNAIIILGNYWKPFISSLVDDDNKIKIVHNAVNCPKTNRYSTNSKKLLFLGAITQRKGIFDLIEAMKILKAQKINTKLYIYGPDFTSGISEIIKENNLIDIIEYKGFLKPDNREKVLNSDIALNILPSYNEGLPMTILETMSYGIPNISTNIAAIPEVITSDNGYLDEPGDYNLIAKQVINFLNDEELRKKMSDNSFRKIKDDFSIEKHIEKIIKIYDEL